MKIGIALMTTEPVRICPETGPSFRLDATVSSLINDRSSDPSRRFALALGASQRVLFYCPLVLAQFSVEY